MPLMEYQNTFTEDVAALNPRLKRITPHSDFAEGDYVSRMGEDVQLVTNMNEDGILADFECVKADSGGIYTVGSVESNLCRRYTRVNWSPR